MRVDLPCAPCNMIRKPPARCQGHTPDCLAGVTVDAVTAAALSLVAETEAARGVIGRLAIERGGRVETIDLDDTAPAPSPTKRQAAPTRGSRACATWTSPDDRCAIGSTTAATRCGGSPSCSCTRKASWTRCGAPRSTLDAVCEVEEPTRVGVIDGGPALRHLLPQVAARLDIGLLPGTDTGRPAARGRVATTG